MWDINLKARERVDKGNCHVREEVIAAPLEARMFLVVQGARFWSEVWRCEDKPAGQETAQGTSPFLTSVVMRNLRSPGSPTGREHRGEAENTLREAVRKRAVEAAWHEEKATASAYRPRVARPRHGTQSPGPRSFQVQFLHQAQHIR